MAATTPRNLRFSDDQWAIFRAAATLAGLSVMAWIRSRAVTAARQELADAYPKEEHLRRVLLEEAAADGE